MVLLWKPNTNAWLTHYSPVLLFCTSWKYQKTERFSVVFMRYRKAPPGCNGLILSGNDFTVLFKNGLSRLINKFHFFLKFVRIGHYNIRIIKSWSDIDDPLLFLLRVPIRFEVSMCSDGLIKNGGAFFSIGTERKLNVHKTFRRRSRHLLNVLCTINLRSMFMGK